jgi:hypothetical protein
LGAAGKKGGPLGEVCCSSHIKVMRSMEVLVDGDWGAETVELLFSFGQRPRLYHLTGKMVSYPSETLGR